MLYLATTEWQWYEPWGNPTIFIALNAIMAIAGIIAILRSSCPVKGRIICRTYGYVFATLVALSIFTRSYMQWHLQNAISHNVLYTGSTDGYEIFLADNSRDVAIADMYTSALIAIGAFFGLISIIRNSKARQDAT